MGGQSYQERILRVLLHIQRNLDRPLELDELASFSALFGVPPLGSNAACRPI